jgi:hypothetical protein
VFVAVALLLMCNQGHAQTPNQLLRGLSEVKLLIEELSPGAKPCGLKEEAIRAAALYPLSSTKIVLKPGAYVTLYIYIITIHQNTNRRCLSNVRVEVWTSQKVTLQFSGDTKFAIVDLWHSDYVVSSYWSDHEKQLSDIIEKEVKNFITDWNLDNKP